MTRGGAEGIFVVKSKTTTLLLPLATNRVFPSAVIASPSGAERGFTPLARAAQHCAPGNPPKSPFGPKPPGRWKRTPPAVADKSGLHPYRVRLPKPETIGGMVGSRAPGKSPPPDTLVAPPLT